MAESCGQLTAIAAETAEERDEDNFDIDGRQDWVREVSLPGYGGAQRYTVTSAAAELALKEGIGRTELSDLLLLLLLVWDALSPSSPTTTLSLSAAVASAVAKVVESRVITGSNGGPPAPTLLSSSYVPLTPPVPVLDPSPGPGGLVVPYPCLGLRCQVLISRRLREDVDNNKD